MIRNLMLMALLGYLALISTGCSRDHLTVERDGLRIVADIEYIMQNKNFKKLTYNSQTGEVTVENFGSETSEQLETFMKLLAGYSAGLTAP